MRFLGPGRPRTDDALAARLASRAAQRDGIRPKKTRGAHDPRSRRNLAQFLSVCLHFSCRGQGGRATGRGVRRLGRATRRRCPRWVRHRGPAPAPCTWTSGRPPRALQSPQRTLAGRPRVAQASRLAQFWGRRMLQGALRPGALGRRGVAVELPEVEGWRRLEPHLSAVAGIGGASRGRLGGVSGARSGQKCVGDRQAGRRRTRWPLAVGEALRPRGGGLGVVFN